MMLPKIASVTTSVIDHPGRVSLVIFLPYCNYNCIACHNRELVEGKFEEVPLEELLWGLERNSLIDMLIISGGEPTIYGDSLLELIKILRIKRGDLPIRVDTNGSLPKVMKIIADYIDGFALDVKAPPLRREMYERIIRREFDLESFMEAVEIASGLPYTIFRTVRYPWLREEDIGEIREFLSRYGGGKPHIINPYFEPEH
jgi:pyruvate formate lyase activating enzyme